MSIDFVAGFVSGLAGLVVGSPLDIIKTAGQNAESSARVSLWRPRSWFAGLLLPILGLGFLNAILFWSYHIVLTLLEKSATRELQLLNSCLAGFAAGICVCIVSVPTELVKVRAQTSSDSSIYICKQLFRRHGILGFYIGGYITIARDAVGYGFYFLTYDCILSSLITRTNTNSAIAAAGGLAGCISWFSIFPLDTIKTRIQARSEVTEQQSLLCSDQSVQNGTEGTLYHQLYRQSKLVYDESGIRGFYHGLGYAMLRAFVVNAMIFWIDSVMRRALQ